MLTVNCRELLLVQVVTLEDNRKLVQDKALKHEDSQELRYQSDMLVKNMNQQPSLLPRQKRAVF